MAALMPLDASCGAWPVSSPDLAAPVCLAGPWLMLIVTAGKLAHERRLRERAESLSGVSGRCVTAILRDASSLTGAASQLAG